jgi:hypothetical protein
LTVSGIGAEAGRDGTALIDTALEWRKQFEAKGWTEAKGGT